MNNHTISRLGIPALVLALSAFASAATAQSLSSSGGTAATGPEVGVIVNELHFGGFGGFGVDGNYWTAPFGTPKSSLGLETSIAVEGGWHHFSGESVYSGTGGVHIAVDKWSHGRVRPFGDVLFGIGHFSFTTDSGNGSETDKLLVLMPGVDIPLQNKSFAVRVEVGQVWDFFSGGHEVAWRYSIGLALPMK